MNFSCASFCIPFSVRLQRVSCHGLLLLERLVQLFLRIRSYIGCSVADDGVVPSRGIVVVEGVRSGPAGVDKALTGLTVLAQWIGELQLLSGADCWNDKDRGGFILSAELRTKATLFPLTPRRSS